MNKKILITLSIFCLLIMTICSYSFATNDGMNNAKNAVMNAGNTVGTVTGTLDNGRSDYTATRTATTNDNLFGMSNTAWTWLILGIVGIVIVALVWYYGAQYEHRNYDND